MWIVFAESTNSHFRQTFHVWLTIQRSLESLSSCVRQGLVHLPIILVPFSLMNLQANGRFRQICSRSQFPDHSSLDWRYGEHFRSHLVDRIGAPPAVALTAEMEVQMLRWLCVAHRGSQVPVRLLFVDRHGKQPRVRQQAATVVSAVT